MKSPLLFLSLFAWLLTPLAADSGCTRHLAHEGAKARVAACADSTATCASCATKAEKTSCTCQTGGTCACPAGQCACAQAKPCCDQQGAKSCDCCAKACDVCAKKCEACATPCDTCTKAGEAGAKKSAHDAATCPHCASRAQAAAPVDPGHPLKGVVLQVMAERQALLVRHEEIPGFMRAMTMMLRVDHATLAAAQKDDAITATIYRDAEGRWALRDVQRGQG